jgi:hypothetical protein
MCDDDDHRDEDMLFGIRCLLGAPADLENDVENMRRIESVFRLLLMSEDGHDFLRRHPDYAAAIGECADFLLRSSLNMGIALSSSSFFSMKPNLAACYLRMCRVVLATKKRYGILLSSSSTETGGRRRYNFRERLRTPNRFSPSTKKK